MSKKGTINLRATAVAISSEKRSELMISLFKSNLRITMLVLNLTQRLTPSTKAFCLPSVPLEDKYAVPSLTTLTRSTMKMIFSELAVM